jgi:DNA-binding GntR family transcriptional regulator
VAEHQQILDALVRRDAVALAALMRSHIANKMRVVVASLRDVERKQAEGITSPT